MEGYRARRDGREFPVASIEELIRLATRGEIRQTDEVLTPNGWVAAGEVPELRARLGNDLFDAWSDLDEADADAVYQKYVTAAPPRPEAPLPFGARAPSPAATPPVPASPAPTPPVPASPTPAPTPPAAARAPAPPRYIAPPALTAEDDPATDPRPAAAARPPGVLAMPAARPPRAEPEPAPDPELPPAEPGELINFPKPPRRTTSVPPLRKPESRPVPLVRASWVILWVGVGLLGVGLWFGWMRMQANSLSGIVVTAPSTKPATPPATPPPTTPPASPSAASLKAVEAELRAGLTSEVRPIRAEGQLGDALLIDLQNLHLDVAAVDAPVLAWSGRARDVPQKAEVHVKLTSQRDLSRQFGGIALAVGRYKRALHLDIPVLEVVIATPEGELTTTLDAKLAEDFYVGRIDLQALLAAQVGK